MVIYVLIGRKGQIMDTSGRVKSFGQAIKVVENMLQVFAANNIEVNKVSGLKKSSHAKPVQCIKK